MNDIATLVNYFVHDFRNPLSTISSYAELAMRFGDTMPPTEMRDIFGKIYQSTHRVNHELIKMLELTRIKRDTAKYETTEFDAEAIIRQVAEQVFEGLETNPSVEFNFPVGRPPLRIRFDENRFRFILAELFSNAEKFGSLPLYIKTGRSDGRAVFYIENVYQEPITCVLDDLQKDVMKTVAGNGFHTGLFIVNRLVTAQGGRFRVNAVKHYFRIGLELPLAAAADAITREKEMSHA